MPNENGNKWNWPVTIRWMLGIAISVLAFWHTQTMARIRIMENVQTRQLAREIFEERISAKNEADIVKIKNDVQEIREIVIELKSRR